ncbi:M28 family peptidase [Mucilaginibacter jinjuensis]|uniref:M28 family peptidase n=1 Tax=Mucilaginibacter jinjuensis TaxID=1176721 RepID=A0ABY7T6Z9_9SPHI|nr:M28 family peptidase [Mucilaginibacter jinjuensis]WCT12131.1 M28 family peptidase [Mucilaginibacter jinjuensis]
MRKIYLGAFALLTANCTFAQKDPVAEKFAKYITVEDAHKHLSIIASDDFEGRETGQPGADKAANYLSGEFKKLGLQGANNGLYFLDVPLTAISAKVSALDINGSQPVYGKDYTAAGISANGNVKASEIVFISNATDADLSAVDIAGKVVLVSNEAKPGANEGVRQVMARFQQVLKNIQAKKPALIFVASTNSRIRGINGAERIGLKKENATTATTIPYFNINVATADQLLKNSGKTYAQLIAAPQVQTLKTELAVSYEYITKDAKAVDVVGFLPGSDPKLKDEVLVFSAHYDHIGLNPNGPDKVNNGADDDGSGTTGILEIATAFTQAKKQGHGPRRSILFLGNVGEEKGLLGSEYYTDHPVIPLERTIADLNIDMIGRTGYEHQGKADSSNYVYVIGSAMLSTTLHKVNEDANTNYTNLVLDYKYDDPNDPNRFYYRSDHYNFAKHGVPIIFYFDGEHQDYHKPGDEVSKINFPMLVKRAQLVFYTGWDLANRDKRPVVDVEAK